MSCGLALAIALMTADPSVALLGELLWIVDLNRQSLDRVVPDVQIHRLRRLIESDPAQPRFLPTVWGVGYVFVPDGTGKSRSSGAPG